MHKRDRAIDRWLKREELLGCCETEFEKEYTLTNLRQDFLDAFRQTFYIAHHTRGSGVKYPSDEIMRKHLGLSPKH